MLNREVMALRVLLISLSSFSCVCPYHMVQVKMSAILDCNNYRIQSAKRLVYRLSMRKRDNRDALFGFLVFFVFLVFLRL